MTSVLRVSNVEFFRLLMIREPGEVVCLNHYIREGIVFKAYDQYSWTWNATDFSEGEVVNEKFRLTFDNPNAATVFKDAVDLAKVSEILSLKGSDARWNVFHLMKS